MILVQATRLGFDVSYEDPTDLDQIEADAALRRVTSDMAAESEDVNFQWIMSGPRGRRFVRQLLANSGVMNPSWSSNAMEMSKREGAKEVGYWLLEQIERLCQPEYHTMMQENENARTVASNRS